MSATNSLTEPSVQGKEEIIDRKFQPMRPETPFGDMALALSGGGFRAAAFCLGAMSYLNRAWLKDEEDTLLKHVSFITSTSGGTLTNTYYTYRLFKPGYSFADFYQKMRNFMDGEALLEEVCDILNKPQQWDERGTRTIVKNGKTVKVKVEKTCNVINSFAKAYDRMLFKDKDYPDSNLFGVYFNRSQNPHLKTVCFNATELNNGISFRFQTNGEAKSIRTVGNYYLHFNDADIAQKLKLGDLAATSSCFPSGFEPMIYPNDYIHPGLTDVDKMLKAIDYDNNNPLKLPAVENEPFCMVDGGVVDNQGLYSMMMEDTYRAEKSHKKQFDLMMVCDVGSYFVDGYQTPPQPDSWYKYLTISKLKTLMPVGAIVFVLSFLLAVLTEGIWRRAGLLLVLSSGFYTLFYLLTLYVFNKMIVGLKSSFGKVIVNFVGAFFKVPFNRLQQMLQTRLKSTLLITTDLFLKQIRRQYYAEFYNMPAYKNRVLSCLIYEFSAQHAQSRLKNLEIKDKEWWTKASKALAPSAQLQEVTTQATSIGTTLWFPGGKQTMRDNIIACGQFTMCYNLLKHIYRLEVLDHKWAEDEQLQHLKKRLLADWKLFNDSPTQMVETGL
ncbi:MAG TPA: patatin-like phospholipase family protein [Mucilaginibacter sp.]|nr:patatin-like phospholipase family protein [Mucilaginibacter sp.]